MPLPSPGIGRAPPHDLVCVPCEQDHERSVRRRHPPGAHHDLGLRPEQQHRDDAALAAARSGGSSMRRQRGGVLDGAAAACRESSTPRERVGRARCPGRGGHARSSLRPNSARLVVVLSGPRGGPTAPAWRWRRSKHGAAGSRASATARTAGGRVLPGQATGPDATASRSTAAWHGAACSCASFHPPSRRTATPVRRTRRPWSPNRS